MKFRIAAAWEGGKVYGLLLGFHTVNFALSSHTAAEREYKFCVKIWFRNFARVTEKLRVILWL